MQRFYLHIRDGDRLVIDRDGIDVLDLHQAHLNALIAARDIVTRENSGAFAGSESRSFEIVDASGELKLTVPFRDVYRGA